MQKPCLPSCALLIRAIIIVFLIVNIQHEPPADELPLCDNDIIFFPCRGGSCGHAAL
jgi:hypothetical protein